MNRAGPWLSAVAVAVAVAGCALRAVDPLHPRAQQVAPGVYLVRGAGDEVDATNLGRLGNAGFIVGPSGVIMVDAGTSRAHGEALLQAVAEVTDRPVKLLVITHTRQEFLFGAAAFRARGVPVRMHRKAALLMAARCEGCLTALRQILGEPAMAGTSMFKPDSVFDATQTLDLIGRRVELAYFDHSSGPGDIAVRDLDTGTVFAGGLVDDGRIPDVQDSDLPGWQRALDALRALRPGVVVPGHGPAGGAAQIDTVQRYLTQLQARAAELVRSGAALSEVPDALALPDFAGWQQYDNTHRRNASIVFLRLERDLVIQQGQGVPQ